MKDWENWNCVTVSPSGVCVAGPVYRLGISALIDAVSMRRASSFSMVNAIAGASLASARECRRSLCDVRMMRCSLCSWLEMELRLCAAADRIRGDFPECYDWATVSGPNRSGDAKSHRCPLVGGLIEVPAGAAEIVRGGAEFSTANLRWGSFRNGRI